MRTSRRVTTWLVILVVLIPGLAVAQRRARLYGKVVDPEGKPIPGVVVTVTCPQFPKFSDVETTDKKGTFTVDFREINVTYHYRFDKAGYQTTEAQQEWHLEGDQRFTWTMQPGTPATAGGLPPASTSEPAILAYNAGVAALKSKDYAAAESKFTEAVALDPKLVQGWVALGAVQLQTGRNREAAESAEKAMALGNRDEQVLTARWQAYRNLKDDAKAAEALKDLQTVGRATEEAKRFHNEGVALVKAGDNAGAFAKFQEALNLDPNLPASLLGLATAGLKIGKNAEAAAAAETILKSDPKNESAIRIRYNACLALGDKEKLFDSLVGLYSVEPVAAKNGLLKLAFEAYDANDVTRAKDRFNKILELDPNQPLAHYYVALLYVNAGDTEQAKAHLERFLALTPNGKEADSARDMLKQLAKIKGEDVSAPVFQTPPSDIPQTMVAAPPV